MSTVHIDKLRGRENYSTWKFAVQTYLQHEELWDCIKPAADTKTVDPKRDVKAKSKIILLVDPIIYVHIQEANTSAEVWKNLETAFEDSGLTRKVGLLRDLVNTTLDSCSNIDEYVNKIVTTAHKLRNIGFHVDDEWLGTLMLAGLPEHYEPMIMGLESSGIKITTDKIKTKLLQEVKESNVAVLYTKHRNAPNNGKYVPKNYNKNTQYKGNGPRCFNCNKYGHVSKYCNAKKKTDEKGYAAVFSAVPEQLGSVDWYVDSGASLHMTNVSDGMYDIRAPPIQKIMVANNTSVTVEKMGNIDLELLDEDGNINRIQVRDILYVPQLSTNLLSVSQLVKNGCQVIFNKTGCEIYSKLKQLVARARLTNNMYKLNIFKGNAFMSTSESQSLEVWHRRMGHLNFNDVNKLPLCTEGVKIINTDENKINCIPCLKGKHTKLPFKNIGSRATAPLELIHSDLCGPMETPSMGGARYFISFIDDYSRKVNVYFLRNKMNVKEVFQVYKTEMENQMNCKIKILRTDNGLEYLNNQFMKYLTDSGIIHQTTVPYTPEQNGLAERKNRSLVERARCMLYDAGLPKQYWAEAVESAAHIINRSPTRVLDHVTPMEKLTGKKPNISHLRIFGCKAMVHMPKEKRLKWDSKSTEMIFLGYCEHTKGYRLLNPINKKITKSRNVIFLEDCLNNANVSDVNTNVKLQISMPLHEVSQDEGIPIPENLGEEQASSSDENDLSTSTITSDPVFQSAADSTYEPSTDCSFDSPNRFINLRPRNRQPHLPGDDEEDTTHACLAVSQDPLTVEEALTSSDSNHWQMAMEEEYKSLMKNNTWILCDLPDDKKAISCKWVFKTKRNEKGEIAKYKARLVIKGCAQKKGFDYNEVYSPVIRYSSLRYLFSLAVKYDLDIDQMDAVSAFLQGDIEETIYMCQPPKFEENNSQVCLLKKSLYGLKQASRQWNKKLDNALKEINLKQSLLDPCIYYRIDNEDITFLAVYVDDLILFTSSSKTKEQIKNHIFTKFEMKDLGEVKYCLGLEVHRDRKNGSLCISQKKYIKDILTKFGMSNCKSVKTPIDPKTKLTSSEKENSISDIVPYQEIVGSLLYLSQGTRPDIAYAVNTLSRFNAKPEMQHWVALKRVLRYLKHTENYALMYKQNKKESLIHGYCDADWASNEDDRRSCTGYVFIFQGGAISWNSRRQQTVALSTTEAEYMSLSSGTQEAMWLKQMQDDFWPHLASIPLTMLCDNQSTIKLAGTENYHSRSKHIDIRHHFVRDKVLSNKLVVKYVQSSEMVADALTKGTPQLTLDYCSSKMGLRPREDVGT